MTTHPLDLLRTVGTIRAGLTILIDNLHETGQPKLSEPFAKMLVELASVDYDGIRQLDDNQS